MRIVQLDFVPEPWRIAALVAIAFVLAWIVSRASKRLAESLVGRYERKHVDPGGATTGVIVGLKRRETLVALVQTSVRYVAYVLATLFAIAQLAGVRGSGAIAGASLLVLLLGFALQRFLIDILSGVFMQFEGWFAIGDSVVIEPSGLTGIVEETSLRSTKLRSVGGDVIYVNNSQISAVRVLPRGVREVSIELVVRDEAGGPAPGRERRARDAGRPDAVRARALDRVVRAARRRARAAARPGRRRARPRVARRRAS